ncbi:type II pantothenate kinase [Bacillus gaemokensis]|uniref:Pantothenate kinase n=1 Tax=Bacillus gaemokensis TaxID=574375 RepID=A0A073K8V2_9BACI|nr:type II pantothenate kinase [Bacillus gaemokensis]KEK22926.1 pantothenate kinase [Bacillus gaemokensis]KYG34727.1 type II pantothenate kinase [Bacillus gaemokensis]
MERTGGIDAGGTLTKVAYFSEDNELHFEKFYSHEQNKIEEWLHKNKCINRLCMTGGRSEQLQTLLLEKYKTEYLAEFEATLAGVHYLIEKEKRSINNFILTNIGTGTSIHYVHNKEYIRAGGTGIGGGTIMGLSKLLTKIDSFEEVIKHGKIGSRANLDITVGDIYNGILSPIDNNLTASNFGKPAITKTDYNKSDLLATIQGLVGEVVTALSLQFAETKDIDHIVYIGSALSNNTHLQDIIGNYTVYQNKKPIFLPDYGFSGAIGALLSTTK